MAEATKSIERRWLDLRSHIDDVVNDRIDKGGWPTRDRAAPKEDG